MSRTLDRPFVAVDLDGHGAHPGVTAGRTLTAEDFSGAVIARRIQAAEAAGVNVITVSDGPLDATAEEHAARLNAIHAASFGAPLTKRAALVAEVDVVFTEPFHTATQLMTLDHVSHGRAGWLIRGTGAEIEATSYGREAAGEERVRREVIDGVEVSRRIWDSWEDDAEIRDVATGRFIDKNKVHYADFVGEHYSVKGSSITPRSPQGQLPVLAPIELADGAEVDGVLVTAASVEKLIDAVGAARAEGHRIVIAEVAVAAAVAGESGADRVARLGEWDPSTVLLTEDIAAQIARIAEVADGVRVRLAETDVDLDEFAAVILPELRQQVDLAESPLGGTFRDLLGLDRPASRYATEDTDNPGTTAAHEGARA